MSKTDEDQIRDRLKRLSQVEPTHEAADRAIQRVRDAMTNREEGRRVGLAPPSLISRLMKLAAAAVLMIGAGYIAGLVSAPRPLDVEELQATLESSLRSSLEPAIRRELLKEVNDRWQSAFAANCAQLKDELQRQVRRDLTEFAAQTLAASGTLTNQRLMELVQLIEAARVQDRRRVAEALEQIELNRLEDRTRFGDGLVTLAAQTNELLGIKEN
jgi:hypothetical protein